MVGFLVENLIVVWKKCEYSIYKILLVTLGLQQPLAISALCSDQLGDKIKERYEVITWWNFQPLYLLFKMN